MGNIRGYQLPIAVAQSATTAAPGVVWSMLNPTTSKRPVYIRRVAVNAMFTGTAAATFSQYLLKRFRSTTPAGGTAMVPVPLNRLDKGAAGVNQVSAVVSQFLDTGLTVAGIAFDGVLLDGAAAAFGAPRQLGACAQYVCEYDSMEGGSGFSGRGALCLDPGDGLALVLGVVAVVGDGIDGFISWDEYGGPG